MFGYIRGFMVCSVLYRFYVCVLGFVRDLVFAFCFI